MKITPQQANRLNRLSEDCDEAETVKQLHTSNTRLDRYVDHLMEMGVDSQDILDAIN